MVVSVAGKYGKCTLTIYIMDIRDINWLTTMLNHLTSMLHYPAQCGKDPYWVGKNFLKLWMQKRKSENNLLAFQVSFEFSDSNHVWSQCAMIQMVDTTRRLGYLDDNRSLMMSIVRSSRVTLHKCYWPYSCIQQTFSSDCVQFSKACIDHCVALYLNWIGFISLPFWLKSFLVRWLSLSQISVRIKLAKKMYGFDTRQKDEFCCPVQNKIKSKNRKWSTYFTTIE